MIPAAVPAVPERLPVAPTRRCARATRAARAASAAPPAAPSSGYDFARLPRGASSAGRGRRRPGERRRVRREFRNDRAGLHGAARMKAMTLLPLPLPLSRRRRRERRPAAAGEDTVAERKPPEARAVLFRRTRRPARTCRRRRWHAPLAARPPAVRGRGRPMSGSGTRLAVSAPALLYLRARRSRRRARPPPPPPRRRRHVRVHSVAEAARRASGCRARRPGTRRFVPGRARCGVRRLRHRHRRRGEGCEGQGERDVPAARRTQPQPFEPGAASRSARRRRPRGPGNRRRNPARLCSGAPPRDVRARAPPLAGPSRRVPRTQTPRAGTRTARARTCARSSSGRTRRSHPRSPTVPRQKARRISRLESARSPRASACFSPGAEGPLDVLTHRGPVGARLSRGRAAWARRAWRTSRRARARDDARGIAGCAALAALAGRGARLAFRRGAKP